MITNEDTFRSYPSKIADIYNNWPKVEDEGNNISLTPVRKGKMILGLTGNTTQNGTPTPDAPVEVINATGEQVVKVVGKNLFDYDDSTVTGYWGNAATKNNNGYLGGWGYFITFPTPLPAGTYTISFKVKDADNSTTANIVFQDINNQNIANSSVNVHANNSKTITSTENIKRIRLDNGQNAVTTLIYDIQIEKGSSATEYEEYKEQSYEINLGKNLFNKELVTLQNRRISTTNGGTYSASGYSISPFIEIKENTNYALTSGIISYFAWYDSTQTFISGDSWSTGTSKASPSNAKYIRFDFQTSNIDNIQLEQGSATEYAPYFTPIELCKIGDYQDRIYYNNGKWYLEKKIGKVVLDGSEEWQSTNSIASGTSRFYIDKNDVAYDGNDAKLIISNNFVSASFLQIYSTDTTSKNLITPASSAGRIIIRIDNTYASTVTNFKTWLETNKPIVYYVLATPTIEEITDSTLINDLNNLEDAKSYNNITNIIITGDTPINMKASALMKGGN